MLQVDTLEPKDEGVVCLENNAIQQSKDLQGKTILSKYNLYEVAEMAEVATSLVSSKPEQIDSSNTDISRYSMLRLIKSDKIAHLTGSITIYSVWFYI